MDENRRLDDELADLTDAVIENREIKTSDDMADLPEVVYGLRDLIEPGDPPPADFEARMRQRLDMEWDQRQRRLTQVRVSPAARVATLAAALVVVLVVMIALTGPPANGGMQGTALGSTEAIIGFVAIVAVVGALVLVWRSRR